MKKRRVRKRQRIKVDPTGKGHCRRSSGTESRCSVNTCVPLSLLLGIAAVGIYHAKTSVVLRTSHGVFLFPSFSLMRGREASMCCCLSHSPFRAPGLQPRHMPWPGTELATLWRTGWHSIHWATQTRASHEFLRLFGRLLRHKAQGLSNTIVS